MAQKEKVNYQNKCSKCSQAPDRIFSLSDLTVAQLKAECRQRNLTRSGNKSSLITTLTPFKEEILATENACTHITPQPPIVSNSSNNNSKPHLNDRSISLPTDYYENMDQESNTKNLVAPLTFNVTCFSGSISNLSFGSYPILINNNHASDAQKIESSDNEKKSTDISKQSSEMVNLPPDSELQHQIAMNSSSVCYTAPMETNSQNNATLFHQQINPILFYKLPTPSGHDPAFIQTSGLEMIQLVQQELLRNIEVITFISFMYLIMEIETISLFWF